MSAPVTTPQRIITSALRKLGAIGSGEAAPGPADADYALDEFNQMLGLWNKRGRKAYYVQNQAFTFSTSQQSYTIGATGSGADFIVQQGGRPVRIEQAQLVLTDESPNVVLPVAVWNWPEYTLISVPALSSQWPFGIYYQPNSEVAKGVIYPYPAFPTNTANQLKLWWAVQFVRFDIDEISTPLPGLPDGYDGAMASNLAVRMWPAFPKRTDLVELKRQARADLTEIEAPNVPPFRISTTDGITSGGSAFSWRSRNFV